jgi:hypothetical protein
VKTAMLAKYAEDYGLDVLIETGLDRGRGSGMFVDVERYIALDYNEDNVTRARGRGFDARHGDSGKLMAEVLNEVDEPALFWLDAHGIDCHSEQVISAAEFPGWEKLPLLRELEAIAAWPHAAKSVVLIDDMPLMAYWVSVGQGGGEAFSWLPFNTFLDGLDVRWDWDLRDRILRLTPVAS